MSPLRASTAVFLILLASAVITPAGETQPYQSTATVCGDPQASCETAVSANPYDLAFRLKKPQWNKTYFSVPFYAVILASRPAVEANSPDDDCGGYFSEAERKKAQALFPHNKVFTSRFGCYGNIGYTNVNSKFNFLAVYGGTSLAEAEKILAKAKKQPGWATANIRRLQVSFFNGCPA